MTETNRIEFKRELTDDLDIEKEVIAFLNSREGGILYFGIDDDGKAIGVSDIDGDMLKIKDRIRTNAISTELTYMSRIDTPLWDERAIHEAVINFIVHNDYSREVLPKFEIFSDRLEITSYGRLPENMSEDEFFNGVSIPRNKELMRIFRDVEMVESLGSGMPRIMQVYGRECFTFMEHFIRFTVPFYKDVTDSVTDNVTEGNSDSQKHVVKVIERVEKDEKHEKSIGTKTPQKTPQKIMDLIMKNPDITTQEMAASIGIDRSNIARAIKKLQERGLVRRVGPDKGGHWEVIIQSDSEKCK